MIKRIYTLMLIPLLVASCTEMDPDFDKPYGDAAISFNTKELTADWGSKASSRGVAVDDVNNVSSIMVYSFLTAQDENTPAPYINNEEAHKGDNNIWSFNPSRHYPLYEELDFLAYTPKANNDDTENDNNGLTQTLDFENKTVKFDYSTRISGRNLPDLMLATPQTEKSRTNKLGELTFNHALTQITMSAKMADGTATKYLNRYKITSFTIYNIKTSGSLDYSVSEGIGDWYDGEYGDCIAKAILPGGNPDYPAETPVLLDDTDFENIMTNGQSLFLIPQPIETSTHVSGKPSIQITITDSQPTTIKQDGETSTTYLTYRTEVMELPSYQSNGWQKGQAVNLQFEFEFDPELVVIPMSIVARLMPWTTQTLNPEVDPNIHAWLDTKTVKANTTTTLKLYTNGTVTSVSGMNAILGAKASDSYYPVTITAGNAGQDSFEVKIKNSQDKTITKKFYINVE